VHGAVTTRADFNHSILIGLRYAFGAAPAPAPAPMPVADMGAKTFLVFFDWDRYELTSRGAGIVRDAAAYSQGNRYTRIDVDGNTDTSGSPGYNQGLSERRARTVANELVRNGVPMSAISMHAYGDTKLLVPTGPGVREPQNRRVEIVFH
jgi:outer membrane protein OmpA-like peptidoglycan-associated protein